MQYGQRIRKVRSRLLAVAAVIASGTASIVSTGSAQVVGGRLPKTERASVGSGGVQAKLGGESPSISADGRFVAFLSYDSDLVPSDKNGMLDVFVHDRQTGSTERVSVASGGGEGNGTNSFAAISGDGRFVAFMSEASNLVAGDTNGLVDIFVHDRQAGTTDRVNVSSAGDEANKADFLTGPSISSDGRFVAFETSATNLVVGANAAYSVFVHDRLTGVTELASVDSATRPAGGSSFLPAISGDGRFVAFASDSPNLVSGDSNGVEDIFVHDRSTGVTERITVDSAGNQGNAGSGYQIPSLSTDGRFVAFGSTASNLVPGMATAGSVFVRDRAYGTTELVSTDSAGRQTNGPSSQPAINSDGTVVAFVSYGSLVSDDTNSLQDVFLHDRRTGQTVRASVNTVGAQASGTSTTPSINANGTVVAFSSHAPNLVPDDTNEVPDVFVHTSAMSPPDSTSTTTTTTIPTSSSSTSTTVGSTSTPIVGTPTILAGTHSDEILHRNLAIAGGVSSSRGRTIVRYEMGWAPGTSANAPGPTYMLPPYLSSVPPSTVDFRPTRPNEIWSLFVRAIDSAGVPSLWAKSAPVHTPGVPHLFALGDSITSGHHRDSVDAPTVCDDKSYGYPQTVASKMISSVPAWWSAGFAYTNLAHSGFSTESVIVGGVNACGEDLANSALSTAATALSGSKGSWNQVVITAGIDDTNWVDVLASVIRNSRLGRNPVYREANCTRDVASWDGPAKASAIQQRVRQIASTLLAADPTVRVKWLSYYNVAGTGVDRPEATPIFPAVCTNPVDAAMKVLSGATSAGLDGLQVQLISTDSVMRSNRNRIQPIFASNLIWYVAHPIIFLTTVDIPGWPHPNRAGAEAIGRLIGP